MMSEKKGWERVEGELMDNEKADFLSLISFALFNGNHTTTYKYCFFKSILENIYSLDDDYVISLEKLNETFSEIYWNMINVYKIPQMTMTSKDKTSAYEKLINDMTLEKSYLDGVRYESIKDEDRKEYLRLSYPNFKRNVIGAFYDDMNGTLYGFSKKERKLWFNDKSVDFLAGNRFILDQVNYYEWLKMIENILKSNSRHIDNLSTVIEEITKRINLTPFKETLLKLGEEKICFYSGHKLSSDFHLDHVIPWDYLKSDNLWNFVFACPSCNTSKNNQLPDEIYIDKLIERNKRLGIPSPDIKKIYKAAVHNGFRKGWKPKEERK